MPVYDSILDSDVPLVAAPMAGGVTTVALAAAAADAGAFPFLAGGYKAAAALADEISVLRGAHAAFGVNLFVPADERIAPQTFAEYVARVAPDFARYDLAPDPRPRHDDDQWREKLAVLREDPVPTVSFTFGLPEPADIAVLRRTGARVLVTVTTVDEARAAVDAGADGLVVQGPRAGGHSATFDPRRAIDSAPTAPLVRAVAATVGVPLIAAGGVDSSAAARELLGAGAGAVAVGTLLLRSDESGATPVHKDALADPAFDGTVVTRAFTGRPARALRNGFVDRHHGAAPTGYPELHHLTRPLRAAAAAAGSSEELHLWAGTGHRAARSGPVGDILARLAAGI